MSDSPIRGELSPQQREHRERLMKVLGRYLPASAVAYCSDLIMLHRLHLHIEVERKDLLGDYSPHQGKGNRISINHNLNPYDFLITFIHELAHHTTYRKHGANHQPHGSEWKTEFKNCMRPVVMMKIFPRDIEEPLIRHMRAPHYTHSGDVDLMKALMRYDKNKNYAILDDLPAGALFKMGERSRIVMKKGQKRKTYVSCEAVTSGKKYLVHAVAKVVRMDAAKK